MRGIRSLVAAAVFALSTTAVADTITVTWGSPIFSPPGAVNVGTVTHPAGTTGTDAGRFHGTVTATTGIDPGGLVDSAANFLAYCHDLAQTIGGTTTYTVAYGASAIMRDFLGAVNSFIAGGDDFDWLHPADATTAAAVQLGIWEALHNDDFVLTTGNVSANAVPLAVANLFQDFVNEMVTAGSLNNALVMTLTHGARQDVITGYLPPGFLVPEPGTLALLGFAVAAAALSRRRRH